MLLGIRAMLGSSDTKREAVEKREPVWGRKEEKVCFGRGQKGKYVKTSGPGDNVVLNEHQAFHRKAHFYQGYGLEQFLEGTSQQRPWPLIRNKDSYHTSSLKEDGSSKTFLLEFLLVQTQLHNVYHTHQVTMADLYLEEPSIKRAVRGQTPEPTAYL